MERLAGESFEVFINHLPVCREVLRVKLHLAGVGGTEDGVPHVDMRPEQQGRDVYVLFSPVMNEVCEYEVDSFVACRRGHLFDKCRHVVVIFSGHAHEVFSGGH